MKLKVKFIDIETGRQIVVLNGEDMKELGLHVGDRIKLKVDDSTSESAIIDGSTF